jgi:hypothetical protein
MKVVEDDRLVVEPRRTELMKMVDPKSGKMILFCEVQARDETDAMTMAKEKYAEMSK